jgi:anti-sigma factor RsiW
MSGPNAPDPRLLELLHAEIDGQLSATEWEELERLLAATPDGPLLRDQLRRIEAALARLPSVPPPADLHQRILRALPAAPRAAAPGWQRGHGRHGRVIRYAMAAGLVVAMVGIGFSGTLRQAFAPGELVATMGGQPGATAPADSVAIDAPGLAGTVALQPDGARWRLVIDLASTGPVAVRAAYDAPAFRLLEVEGNAPAAGLATAPGRIGFSHPGDGRTVLVLQPGEGGQLTLRFESAGRAPQQAVIEVPAGPP